MSEQPPIPEGTGARIKARRQQLELTQAQVADRVAERVGRNYREGWLAQIERGKASLLLNAAIALADVLTMSLDEMLGRSDYRMLQDKVLPGAMPPLDDALAPVEYLEDHAAAAQTRKGAKPRGRAGAAAKPPRA